MHKLINIAVPLPLGLLVAFAPVGRKAAAQVPIGPEVTIPNITIWELLSYIYSEAVLRQEVDKQINRRRRSEREYSSLEREFLRQLAGEDPDLCIFSIRPCAIRFLGKATAPTERRTGAVHFRPRLPEGSPPPSPVTGDAPVGGAA